MLGTENKGWERTQWVPLGVPLSHGRHDGTRQNARPAAGHQPGEGRAGEGFSLRLTPEMSLKQMKTRGERLP